MPVTGHYLNVSYRYFISTRPVESRTGPGIPPALYRMRKPNDFSAKVTKYLKKFARFPNKQNVTRSHYMEPSYK